MFWIKISLTFVIVKLCTRVNKSVTYIFWRETAIVSVLKLFEANKQLKLTRIVQRKQRTRFIHLFIMCDQWNYILNFCLSVEGNVNCSSKIFWTSTDLTFYTGPLLPLFHSSVSIIHEVFQKFVTSWWYIFLMVHWKKYPS